MIYQTSHTCECQHASKNLIRHKYDGKDAPEMRTSQGQLGTVLVAHNGTLVHESMAAVRLRPGDDL